LSQGPIAARSYRRSVPKPETYPRRTGLFQFPGDGNSPMRCYFNLVHADRRIPDLEGIEVDDVEEARIEARKAVDEFRLEDEFIIQDWEGWRLEVTDPAGTVLFTIDLDGTTA
jgi:hypothetical protein